MYHRYRNISPLSSNPLMHAVLSLTGLVLWFYQNQNGTMNLFSTLCNGFNEFIDKLTGSNIMYDICVYFTWWKYNMPTSLSWWESLLLKKKWKFWLARNWYMLMTNVRIFDTLCMHVYFIRDISYDEMFDIFCFIHEQNRRYDCLCIINESWFDYVAKVRWKKNCEFLFILTFSFFHSNSMKISFKKYTILTVETTNRILRIAVSIQRGNLQRIAVSIQNQFTKINAQFHIKTFFFFETK